MTSDDYPEDVEMSRDSHRIVTAIKICITCRHCWQDFVGGYPFPEFDAHMGSEHPDV